MIIVIPTKEEGEKSFVSDTLGRANYFYVYDTEEEHGFSLNNSYKDESHGAGVKTAEFILKQKANVLITPRIGEKALELLLDTDVKIYKSTGKIVSENIKSFLDNQLEELY